MKGWLQSIIGIGLIRTNHITGSIVIVFNPDIISDTDLIKILSGFPEKPEKLKSHLYPLNYSGISLGENQWCTMSYEELCRKLGSNPFNGLTHRQAALRQKKYGLNIIKASKSKSILTLFFGQFGSFLMQILIVAGIICLFLGEWVDALSIIAIVMVECVLGVFHEYKAQQSVIELKNLTSLQAKVIRQGKQFLISSQQLIPGDVVLLQAGNSVPADGRLIEANSLEVIEAPLTGESYAVVKTDSVIASPPENLGDMHNMVFMGTNVIHGKGKMLVTAIGINTQMGKISQLIRDIDNTPSSLQEQINRLGFFITCGCIACSVLVFGMGITAGKPMLEVLRTSVVLAVGAIPESLSTILTISMSAGLQRMVKQNAIVRKLPSIETLAHTTIICSDKTGTLTSNEMTVKEVYAANFLWEISGEGYNCKGSFTPSISGISDAGRQGLEWLMLGSCLCNNAAIKNQGEKWAIEGDPTEAALLIAAEKYGMSTEDIRDQWKCIREIPFKAENMRMLTLCENSSGEKYAFAKGAPDIIETMCSRWMGPDGPMDMNEINRHSIKKSNAQMADKALRVISIAYKPIKESDIRKGPEELEKDFVFCGLIGMIDPPRPNVWESIKKCHDSGIKVVMITGDHENTASAIAKQLGILRDGKVINGSVLNKTSHKKLLNVIDSISVFSRIAPEQKLRIVKAYKEKGYIVAMTGDGVNDAPAVKESHIGIAMGKNGTDVTREASCITLTDDNFSTIVKAMEEGKNINQNIKKFLRYMLAGNLGEVIAVLLATVTRLPMPMVPSQILFTNLATEGIPALALGIDAPPNNIMQAPAGRAGQEIFDGVVKQNIIIRGIGIGLSTFGIFTGTYLKTGNLVRAQTMAFSNIVISQMFHALDCREYEQKTRTGNPYLMPSIAASGIMLLATLYVPGLCRIFHTMPLSIPDWLALIFSSGIVSRLDQFMGRRNDY